MGEYGPVDMNPLLVEFEDCKVVGQGRLLERTDDRPPVVHVEVESATLVFPDGREYVLGSGTYAITSHGLFRQLA